jgi:hypothetical protein
VVGFGTPVPAEGCSASANIGRYDSDGPGDVPWSSGDGARAAPGPSRETGWLLDVSVASDRSASPDVDSLSLEFEAGGSAGWPDLSASTAWSNIELARLHVDNWSSPCDRRGIHEYGSNNDQLLIVRCLTQHTFIP